MIVPSRAKRDLENENYYNVINGYKELFLQVDRNGKYVVPEVYKSGTQFDELFSLYKLDRKMRNTLLEYLLVFETHIKSRIAYYFSEKYQEPHSYLYFKNYSNDPSKTDDIVKMVATFSSIMSNRRNKPLKHYINTHNGVPLWILVNYITLGSISKMYNNLDDNLRIKIAKDFKNKLKREYHIKLQIDPKDIDSVLQQAHMFRNVCAHEERLYDYKIAKSLSKSNIFANYNKVYKKSYTPTMNGSYIFDLVITLSLFLNKTDFKKLVKKLNNQMNSYVNDFKTISIQDLYYKMNFPQNKTFIDLI
ncbi:abortive infection bacteriophage resistance protein [Staphylococcus devriesei]|nr:abortive infection bacteriophage resistance protein [Staphylococcus devriesei]